MKGPSDSLQDPSPLQQAQPLVSITSGQQWIQEPNSSLGYHQAARHFFFPGQGSWTIRGRLSHDPLSFLCDYFLFVSCYLHFDFQATVTYLLHSDPSTACFFQQLMDSEGSALSSFPLCLSMRPFQIGACPPTLDSRPTFSIASLAVWHFRRKHITFLHSKACEMETQHSHSHGQGQAHRASRDSLNQATLPSLISHHAHSSRVMS